MSVAGVTAAHLPGTVVLMDVRASSLSRRAACRRSVAVLPVSLGFASGAGLLFAEFLICW